MAFESLDDAMLWHGSLIGYMAGVKSACKDEDKSSLLLRMADTQARLEFMEAENAKLRELVKDLHTLAYGVLPERKSDYITICSVELCIDYYSRTMPAIEQRMRELGLVVDE